MAGTARERIIEAAERLFAQRGIAAVSLREISAAANQRNTSAVQYHFGSKHGLIEAIHVYRLQAINERRLALLAELDGDGRAADLRSLAGAMIYPVVESLRAGSCYVRFAAQALADPEHSRILSFRFGERDAMHEANTRVVALSRGVAPELCIRRLFLAARLWVQALAEQERELETGQTSMPTAALAAELVDLVAVMITAPVSPVTRGAMAPRTRRTALKKGILNREPGIRVREEKGGT